MNQNNRSTHRRPGVSMLELQTAMVVFGILLTGLAPLVVMQLRQLKKLEQRFSDQTTYYLAPASDPWARKLGAAAAISSTAPGTGTASGPGTVANTVQILSLDKPFAVDEMTVHVSLAPVPP